jgi:SAM-dependent methyltransferase
MDAASIPPCGFRMTALYVILAKARIHSVVLFMLTLTAAAQERYSPFIPSEESEVVRMLKLAGVREGDVVFDLGSGDGRIVLEAARMNAGAQGRGIEMDEKLVADSTAAAKTAGLAPRVRFINQNAFDADLSEATVITMWLWPEVMLMLRPKVLAEAKAGTRVVTRLWDLGTWPADEVDRNGTAPIFKWIVPARVGGYWDWSLALGDRTVPYTTILDQRYQTVEGFMRAANRRTVLNDVKLRGDSISFSALISIEGTRLIRHQFSGTVKGDVIEGTVTVLREPYDKPVELPWRATRAASSGYFAPTGMDSEIGRY